jgi:hypothetical protein
MCYNDIRCKKLQKEDGRLDGTASDKPYRRNEPRSLSTLPAEHQHWFTPNVAAFRCLLIALLQYLFAGHDAHLPPRIWKLFSAINATHVIETRTVTPWPRSVAMVTAKEVSPNPLENFRQTAHVCLL